MKAQRVTQHVNEIVALDLVSGNQIVGRLKSVTEDTLVISRPAQFVMMPGGQPGQIQVGVIRYGQPHFDPPEEMEVRLSHVITIFSLRQDQIAGYTQATSGITMAPGGALGALPSMDAILKRARGE